MGIILLEEENFDDAIHYFEQALVAEPDAQMAMDNLKIAKERKKSSGGIRGMFKGVVGCEEVQNEISIQVHQLLLG